MRTRRWPLILALLLAVGLGVGWWLSTRGRRADDLAAAAVANARGVGLMEKFQYAPAVEAFAEAERLAPGWTPAKINRGIALLNAGGKAAADAKANPNAAAAGAEENIDVALRLFAEVLKAEPENRHALYCTALLLKYRGDLEAAFGYYDKVAKLDPTDAHAVYFRGYCRPNNFENPDTFADYQRALELNPYLNAARYGLAQHALQPNEKKREMLDEFQRLIDGNVEQESGEKYTEFGKYAEVIGSSPVPHPAAGPLPVFEPVPVPLPGITWAADDKLDPLRKAVRGRFGAGVTLLDFNRDGRPDVLLLSAAVRDGQVRDVLLRNDGGAKYTDVTAAAGLDKLPGSLAAAVADSDNDGRPDLLLSSPAGVRLLRNADGQRFEDVTAAAGLDKVAGVVLSAAWVDLDMDGDLDLLLGVYAENADAAAKRLGGEAAKAKGRLLTFANVGVAPPSKVGEPVPPLSTAFKPQTTPEALRVSGPVSAIVACDLDSDKDIDLLVFLDTDGVVGLLNDRLMRFHRAGDEPPKFDGESVGQAMSGLVLDANGDDQSDVLVLSRQGATRLLSSLGDGLAAGQSLRFLLKEVARMALTQAARTDIDLDGRADVVGRTADGTVVLLRGTDAGLEPRTNDPFGPAAKTLAGIAVAELTGDCHPDLLGWSPAAGLTVFRSSGTGNSGVFVRLTGKRDRRDGGVTGKNQRTNADGIGAKVFAHAGPVRGMVESTTLEAGPAGSRLPLLLGIGKATQADAVRVRWPDFVVQAEVGVKACEEYELVEDNRKPTSCPVLFTWDGTRWVYVTDCLGAGALGEAGPDGSLRMPRPEESLKIEPHQLRPTSGRYRLKLAEPMDEVMYLDHVRLEVIDHPPGQAVFPDERFSVGPPPTGEPLLFGDRLFPVKATDHRGRDVTDALKERDRRAADGFAVRSWLGYAEEHAVELDFGPGLRSLPGGRRFLVLAGWTEYPYPESIYAATQAGVAMLPPVLEQKQADGTWKKLADIGFPAGLSRVMTAEVTNLIDPAGGPLRLRTNLQIYWDQACLAALAPSPAVRSLPVVRAVLEHRGFAQEVRPGGKLPIEYDHDRLEPVSVTPWVGRLTRLGDVTELLTGLDDRHVLAGPGDEVTAEFEALPPPAAGLVRSFVLRTHGYCKDTAPTTMTGGRVGPLPYRGMPTYPYDPSGTPDRLREYDRSWNTRPGNGGR